jgi:hypothetical protein
MTTNRKLDIYIFKSMIIKISQYLHDAEQFSIYDPIFPQIYYFLTVKTKFNRKN